jgi:hypothetical protein
MLEGLNGATMDAIRVRSRDAARVGRRPQILRPGQVPITVSEEPALQAVSINPFE